MKEMLEIQQSFRVMPSLMLGKFPEKTDMRPNWRT
jgi:hypothetical protein